MGGGGATYRNNTWHRHTISRTTITSRGTHAIGKVIFLNQQKVCNLSEKTSLLGFVHYTTCYVAFHQTN